MGRLECKVVAQVVEASWRERHRQEKASSCRSLLKHNGLTAGSHEFRQDLSSILRGEERIMGNAVEERSWLTAARGPRADLTNLSLAVTGPEWSPDFDFF